MTLNLYAQPYDLAATGFYFEDFETFDTKSGNLRNQYGEVVEEFEIQFIDGEGIDCALAQAFGLHQSSLSHFFNAVENWSDDEKLYFIIAVGECGYSFDPETVEPYDFDVDLYQVDNLVELAEQFVEEGLYGEIPESLRFYIDYVGIGRDLSADYGETVIVGINYVYRCA